MYFYRKDFAPFIHIEPPPKERGRNARDVFVRRDLIESLPSAPTASTAGCLGIESYAAPSPDPTTPHAEGKRYYYTRCTVLKIYKGEKVY